MYFEVLVESTGKLPPGRVHYTFITSPVAMFCLLRRRKSLPGRQRHPGTLLLFSVRQTLFYFSPCVLFMDFFIYFEGGKEGYKRKGVSYVPSFAKVKNMQHFYPQQSNALEPASNDIQG